ncbi:mitochondrial 54S ribosomal protein mrpl1 [Myotisia sp. PD_48]|nr:mitochondrial 54S ribosomal protein mrpl1 [Myotisia sp. PD_48]
MAAAYRYISPLTRSVLSSVSHSLRPQCSPAFTFLCPFQQQSRSFQSKGSRGGGRGAKPDKSKKKRLTTYKQPDMKDAIQFSLCDAMRYLRAYEVGRPIDSMKYEVHVRLRTKRNGPVIRNKVLLPHVVRSDLHICVICPPGSKAAKDAEAAGAELIGEEEVFKIIKEKGPFGYTPICHTSSLQKLKEAKVARILGPKGVMPSVKLGTVVDDVATAMANMRAKSPYRERTGVVKLAIGQLGFTPEQLRNNLATFLTQLKKDAGGLSDQISKDIAEVVLSSTNGPGFSLNGDFKSETSVPTGLLSGS